MKFFRRFFSSWPILLSASISLGIYLLLPKLVRMYDPTTGVYDGGYLLWIGLGNAVAFGVAATGWVIWQLAFGSIDKATSSKTDEFGNLSDWFHMMTPFQKWMATQITFSFCILYVLACLWLVSNISP